MIDQQETRIIDPATGGAKGSKLCRMDLIPAEALWKIGELYGVGAKKYECKKSITLEEGIRIVASSCTCKTNPPEFNIGRQNVIQNGDMPPRGYVSSVIGNNTQRSNTPCATPTGTDTHEDSAELVMNGICGPSIRGTQLDNERILSDGNQNTSNTSNNIPNDIGKTLDEKRHPILEIDIPNLQNSDSIGKMNSTSLSYRGILVQSAEKISAIPNDYSKSTTTMRRNSSAASYAESAIKPSDCLMILQNYLKKHLSTCESRRRCSFSIENNQLRLTETGMHNWRKGYKWSLSIAALLRHLWQFISGESYDRETKCHHLAAVCFHAMALMTFEEEHPELDDRFKLKGN